MYCERRAACCAHVAELEVDGARAGGSGDDFGFLADPLGLLRRDGEDEEGEDPSSSEGADGSSDEGDDGSSDSDSASESDSASSVGIQICRFQIKI